MKFGTCAWDSQSKRTVTRRDSWGHSAASRLSSHSLMLCLYTARANATFQEALGRFWVSCPNMMSQYNLIESNLTVQVLALDFAVGI